MDVIFPAQPLLIVDRQYRQKGSRIPGSLALPNRPTKRDVTISLFGKPKAERPELPSARTVTQEDSLQRRKFQFVNVTHHSKNPHTKRRSVPKPNSDLDESGTGSIASRSSAIKASGEREAGPRRPPSLQLGSLVPKSSTTFYGYAGIHVKSDAQELLHYCTLS